MIVFDHRVKNHLQTNDKEKKENPIDFFFKIGTIIIERDQP